MKYMIAFPLSADSFKVRTARFLETGGAPPEGVTMLGRWHSLGLDEAFVLAEADDPGMVYRWISQWADLVGFRVVPVIEDEQAAEILKDLQF